MSSYWNKCNNHNEFKLVRLDVTKYDRWYHSFQPCSSLVFSSCSGSLCVVQTDHLPLEKLHSTRLSRLPATEECQRQAHPTA